MAKDPAVLLYTADFLTGTAHFTHEELGAYTRLLFNQQQRGGLSLDFIKRICGVSFDHIWPVIREKFIEKPPGIFFNERMVSEVERRKKYSDGRKKNLKSSDHMASHMETVTETSFIINKRKEKFEAEVLMAPNLYPVEMLEDFIRYWTEPSTGGIKMRFEMQKTWSLKGRLVTWAKNQKNFNKNGRQNQTTGKERVDEYKQLYANKRTSNETGAG